MWVQNHLCLHPAPLPDPSYANIASAAAHFGWSVSNTTCLEASNHSGLSYSEMVSLHAAATIVLEAAAAMLSVKTTVEDIKMEIHTLTDCID